VLVGVGLGVVGGGVVWVGAGEVVWGGAGWGDRWFGVGCDVGRECQGGFWGVVACVAVVRVGGVVGGGFVIVRGEMLRRRVGGFFEVCVVFGVAFGGVGDQKVGIGGGIGCALEWGVGEGAMGRWVGVV